MFPSAPGGDSAELIIAAYQMSVAHPPGYPLFTWLGKLFTFIPFGTIAWRVNLMSVMCGVLSAVFMFRAVALWTSNNWAGFLSAAMYSFTPLIWTYTVQAEVFSMNNMFVNLLLYVTVLYAYSKSDALVPGNDAPKKHDPVVLAHVGAFLGGLSLTNQHTIVIFLVPIIVWVTVVVGRRELLFVRERWVSLFGVMLLGMTPYLHLLVSPMINPHKYSWGDTSTLSGFKTHFLREEYGTLRLYSGTMDDGSGLWERWGVYFGNVHKELHYLGLPLAALGAIVALKGKRFQPKSVGTLVMVAYLIYTCWFFRLTNLPINSALHLGVLMRFFMQPNALVCIWMGIGFSFLADHLFPAHTSTTQKKTILGATVLAIVAFHIGKNFNTMDQSQNWFFYDYGLNILQPLPQHAVLLVGGDLQSNIPQYLQLCEGIRTDVDVLPMETMSWDWYTPRQGVHFPNVTFPGYTYHPWKQGAYSMKRFLDVNIKDKKREVFVAGEWKQGDPTHQDHFKTLPFGMTQRVLPVEQTVDLMAWKAILDPAMPRLEQTRLPNDTAKYSAESWESVALANFWEAYNKKANVFLQRGFDRNAHDSEACFHEVTSTLEYVRQHHPSRWSLKYLGVAYDHLRYKFPHDKEWGRKVADIWSEYLAYGREEGDKDFDTITKAVETAKMMLTQQ
eukprot:TRINITY_DN10721_c0_g1_i1.p1 TRINITY_DN10721_c0_g1~~TRINITY_DN10721_c0_g1_i1.p1  ORF type:complete len:736 (-),score=159.46 TRINITY_DN10721_c0_g1_i1:19-2034(-)